MVKATLEQQKALDFFQELYEKENQKRFFLGFKMGKGKTYSSLMLFKQLKVENFFIIIDANLKLQWIESYKNVYEKDNIGKYDKPKDEEIIFEELKNGTFKGVYVITYDRFTKVSSLIIEYNKKHKTNPITINYILDESQSLKSHTSNISKSFIKINPYVEFAALLSGNIISKNLHQLYTQYIILNHNNLTYQNWVQSKGNKKDISYWSWITHFFETESTRYAKMVPIKEKESLKNVLITDFQRYGYFIENDFDGIEIEYKTISPEDKNAWFKTDYKWIKEKAIIDKENHIIALLDSPLKFAVKIRTSLSGFVYGNKITDDIIYELDNFFKLNPNGIVNRNIEQLKTNDDKEVIKLINHKESLLKKLLKENQNYLIFHNFTEEANEIARISKEEGYEVFFINGKINQKEEIVKRNHTKSVVIIQYEAGARGIDGLQKDFNKLIHYSLTYSPEKWEQANGRVFRMHQKNNVTIYHLIVSEIEEKILENLFNGKKYSDLLFQKDLQNMLHDINFDNFI